MGAYILFVYPQQAEFEATDFSKIDTSRFDVQEGTEANNKQRFCSRIRNSLAHGRFNLRCNDIEFEDQRHGGTDRFRVKIGIKDFGDFINSFMQEVKNQYFRK